MDGTAQIQFKITLKIVIMSVPADQMLDILHSILKLEDAHVIIPQMDARMIIYIMTTMLIASLRVIIKYLKKYFLISKSI